MTLIFKLTFACVLITDILIGRTTLMTDCHCQITTTFIRQEAISRYIANFDILFDDSTMRYTDIESIARYFDISETH